MKRQDIMRLFVPESVMASMREETSRLVQESEHIDWAKLERLVDNASYYDADRYEEITKWMGHKYKGRFRHSDGWLGIVWYAYQPQIPGWSGTTVHVFRVDGVHDVIGASDIEYLDPTSERKPCEVTR